MSAERKSSLGRNSFWLLLARLTAQGLNVIFAALLARRLGVSVFGQFSVIASLVILGNTFTTFGTETLLIRETAKSGQFTSLASRVFGLQLALSGAWWVVTIIVDSSPPLLLYTLSLFPLALISVSAALMRAFERMDLYWVVSLGSGLVQCALVFASANLESLCLYLFLGQTFVALLANWICRISLPHYRLIPSADFYPILRIAFPFAAMTTLSVLTQRLGIFSISLLQGNPDTGLFASASRVVEALKLGHYAILGALLPALSQGRSESGRHFRYSLVTMLVASIVLAAGASILARPLILVIYGSGFDLASQLLTVLTWSLVPYTIGAFISVALVARGGEYQLLKAMLVSVTIFVIAYFFMIHQFGLSGAAWAALIGETFQAFILIWVILKFKSDIRSNTGVADGIK